MEFLIFIVAVLVSLIVVGWRRDRVIESAADDTLIQELKRRAYRRKLKVEADAEVEAAVHGVQ